MQLYTPTPASWRNLVYSRKIGSNEQTASPPNSSCIKSEYLAVKCGYI